MADERVRPRDAAWLAAIAVMWGFNFVPIRWALDEVPPFALASVRFLLAALPIVLFVPRPRAPARIVIAYGLAIGVGQFGLLFLALRLGMAAGLASLLMQVQVFITIGLAALVLRDRVSAPQLAGAVIAAAGVGILAWEKAASGATSSLAGLLLILGAAASWAAGNVIAKAAARRHGSDPFSLVVWSSLVSPLPLAAMSFAAEGGAAGLLSLADASLLAWASILFMSYAATLWGFATWNRMLQRYHAAVVTPFALLVPVAGLASAAIFLREPMTIVSATGAAIVLVGLAVTLLVGARRAPSSGAAPAPPPTHR